MLRPTINTETAETAETANLAVTGRNFRQADFPMSTPCGPSFSPNRSSKQMEMDVGSQKSYHIFPLLSAVLNSLDARIGLKLGPRGVLMRKSARRNFRPVSACFWFRPFSAENFGRKISAENFFEKFDLGTQKLTFREGRSRALGFFPRFVFRIWLSHCISGKGLKVVFGTFPFV